MTNPNSRIKGTLPPNYEVRFVEGYYHNLTDALTAPEDTQYGASYSITKAAYTRRKKSGEVYDPEGEIFRYDFKCTCRGSSAINGQPMQRKRSTQGVSCWHHVKVVHRKEVDLWRLEFICNLHCHRVALDKLGDPAYRRFWRRRYPGVAETQVERLSLTG
ncbi:hypothetical protein K470DRAFT_258135 [Piedraia hortae CBS 480.64]|uniref:FAR1 domain-containing protein n=1 Tax=Piedraia hortae CBS 480.64 TaxID=1314780 RepID=A0A6A7C0B8_9PEZI|nr:hypothetical protein K470DRAFT_258135 [Piedraia hortae CBS 480.64]